MWGDAGDAARDDFYSRAWRSMHGQGGMSLSFSSDGRKMAAVSHIYDRLTVRLWDRNGENEVASRIELSDGGEFRSGFTPDSQRVWVLIRRYFATGELMYFDAETGKSLPAPDLKPHQDDDTVIHAKTGRVLILSKFDGGEARLWDFGSGKQIAKLPLLSTYNNFPSFSPDGKWIAAVERGQAVSIWDASTGVLRSTLSGHTSAIKSIAFSADNRLIASGSEDGTARVWEVDGGKLLHTFAHHAPGDPKTRSTVSSVAFGEGGKVLAARTEHGTSLWRLGSEERSAIVPREGSRVSFSPDGRILVRHSSNSRSFDHVFSRVDDAVQAARKAVVRCLTPEERKAAFVDVEPPDWCIEMDKPPYQAAGWKSWLAERKAGQALPMPASE
jgi:WD40 repeat protein